MKVRKERLATEKDVRSADCNFVFPTQLAYQCVFSQTLRSMSVISKELDQAFFNNRFSP